MRAEVRSEYTGIFAPGVAAIAFVLSYIHTHYSSVKHTAAYPLLTKLTEVFTTR